MKLSWALCLYRLCYGCRQNPSIPSCFIYQLTTQTSIHEVFLWRTHICNTCKQSEISLFLERCFPYRIGAATVNLSSSFGLNFYFLYCTFEQLGKWLIEFAYSKLFNFLPKWLFDISLYLDSLAISKETIC